MDNIFKKFIKFREDNKKSVKISTLNIYKRNIKLIIELLKGKNYQFKNMDIFFEYNKVFKLIEKYSVDKQKKIINAIMVFLMDDKKYKEIKNKYYKYKSGLEKKITERRKEQIKTKKESDNWLTFKELNNVVNNCKRRFIFLNNKVKSKIKEGKKVRLNFNNSNSESFILNKSDEQIILNYLITQLYCGDPFNHGPRRTIYSTFRIVSIDVFKNLKDKDKLNLLIVENKSNKRFQFAEYKTSSYNEEPYIIKLSSKMNYVLNNIIPYLLLYNKQYYDNKWYKNSFNIPLIRNINTKEQAQSYNMTKIIQGIFKDTKCNISVNQIRKIIISEFYNKLRTKEEKEKYAKSCGHNITTAEYTYNKVK